MRHYGYGYRSYRGGSPVRKFLKVLLVLILLAGLTAGLSILFMQRYISYSSEGIRLDLPFFQTQKDASPPREEPASAEFTVPEPTILPPKQTPVHAILLPTEALTDGTALAQAQAAGCTGVIFDMKPDSGTLEYVSQLSLAIDGKSSGADPTRNDSIRTLNQTDELYTIARVSCFRDAKMAKYSRALSFRRKSGSLWRDDERIGWLNPGTPAVQDYISGICTELAALGFDEILLVNSGYPERGKIEQIRKNSSYDSDLFPQTVGEFYNQLQKVLAPTGIKLSILTDTTVAGQGINAVSGQTVDNLIAAADRIWLENPPVEAKDVFASHGLLYVRYNVVSISSKTGSKFHSWAVF